MEILPLLAISSILILSSTQLVSPRYSPNPPVVHRIYDIPPEVSLFSSEFLNSINQMVNLEEVFDVSLPARVVGQIYYYLIVNSRLAVTGVQDAIAAANAYFKVTEETFDKLDPQGFAEYAGIGTGLYLQASNILTFGNYASLAKAFAQAVKDAYSPVDGLSNIEDVHNAIGNFFASLGLLPVKDLGLCDDVYLQALKIVAGSSTL